MGIQKCKRCGKVFAANGNKVCPDCLRKEEDDYKIVKDYLWEHPGATIKKIHHETGVEQKLIKKFVREGRFKQIKGVNLMVECERCGKPISSGRFCDECSDKLKSGFNSIKQVKKKEIKKEKKDAMFIKDRHKKR